MVLPVYVTLQELKDALAQGAGPGARTAANLPDPRLQAALDDAHAEVLGKAATLYTLPADPQAAPTMLRSIILAVAAYAATLEWMQGKDLSERDAVLLRYQRAIGMLRQIVSGELTLELDPAAGGGSFDAEAYDSLPALDLAGDVPAPTYGGLTSGNWQGGGRSWGPGTW